MNLTQEELHKFSPYQEVHPKPQSCTHCGALTSPRIITKQTDRPSIVVQEAHWICGRCNNRFSIGRLKQ
jgi:hypothetical protein